MPFFGGAFREGGKGPLTPAIAAGAHDLPVAGAFARSIRMTRLRESMRSSRRPKPAWQPICSRRSFLARARAVPRRVLYSGDVHGPPVGLAFLAAPGCEQKLINLPHASQTTKPGRAQFCNGGGPPLLGQAPALGS